MAKKDVAKKDNVQTKNKDEDKDKEITKGLNAADFINKTKEELSKVVWPSRQQLISESVAVILMVTLVATAIYLIDNLFSWGAGKVFG